MQKVVGVVGNVAPELLVQSHDAFQAVLGCGVKCSLNSPGSGTATLN